MRLSRSSLMIVSFSVVIVPALFALLIAYQSALRPSEMLQAARQGDLASIERLLAQGTSANVRDEWDTTPLMLAAGWGHLRIVRTLIDGGAAVNERSRFNRTPLMWAAESGQEDVVRFLLETGADKDLVDQDGKSAIDLANANNHPNVAKSIQSHENRDRMNETK